MRKTLRIFTALLSLLIFVSCFNDHLFKESIIQEGDMIVRTYDLYGFNEIEIRNINVKNGNNYIGCNLNITTGDKAISIESGENILDDIKVSVIDGKLKIVGNSMHIYETDYVKINISGYIFEDFKLSNTKGTVKSGTTDSDDVSIDLSGCSYMDFEYFEVNELDIDASSASALTIDVKVKEEVDIDISGASQVGGTIITKKTEAKLSGASLLDISGESERTDAKLSGASIFKSYDFSMNSLEIKLSGASSAFVTVNKSINGYLSGASVIEYIGDAVVNVKTSGASSCKKNK